MMHQVDAAGRLESIQISLPRLHVDAEGEWTSGIFKQPVSGPVVISESGLEQDGQADLEHHGGTDKAILAYSSDHYPRWRSEHGFDFSGGAFGENLTVSGVDESQVCIGDRWQIDNVILEVTQPRQPCWKLARRWQIKLLPKLVVNTARSGWYLRVVQAGTIQAGQSMVLESRPRPHWSVARASQVFYRGPDTLRRELTLVPELSDAWKDQLSDDST